MESLYIKAEAVFVEGCKVFNGVKMSILTWESVVIDSWSHPQVASIRTGFFFLFVLGLKVVAWLCR